MSASPEMITAERCEFYAIALYLQDSIPKSGLSIVSESHHDPNVAPDEVLQLPSRLGEAVIFDVRLTHTGQLPDAVETGPDGLTGAMKGGNWQGGPEDRHQPCASGSDAGRIRRHQHGQPHRDG
jgi:hypothetical protein